MSDVLTAAAIVLTVVILAYFAGHVLVATFRAPINPAQAEGLMK